MVRHLLLCTFAAIAVLVSQYCLASDKSDEQLLREADAALQAAIDDKNLDQLMSFYAEDAVLLPTAEPLVNGKQNIRHEWEHILAIPGFRNSSKLTTVKVASAGDMAYTTGTYEAWMMGEEGEEVVEPGKWVTVWNKGPEGEWRIILETYNTDIPPPDHK